MSGAMVQYLQGCHRIIDPTKHATKPYLTRGDKRKAPSGMLIPLAT